MASSSAAHKLRNLAHKILTEEECSFLKVTIRRFRETHSVLGLCISLKRIIDSPERIHLLPYINAMIPQHLQNDFQKLCQLQFKHYRPQDMKEPPEIKVRESKRKSDGTRHVNQRLILPVEEFHNQRNKERIVRPSDDVDCSDHTLSRRKNSSGSGEPKHGLHKRSKTYHADTSGGSQEETSQSSKRELIQKLLDSSAEMNISELELLLGEDELPKGKRIRKVVLHRRQGQSLGFSIRGGKDLKAGIFISEVDSGGQADRKGLKVGERILKVNDQVFKDITHAQAVVCLKSAQRLNLFVAPIGQMPGGTPSSTPRSTCPSVGASSHGSRYSSKESLSSKDPESSSQKVVVMADEDGWLGFSIRGGVDQGIEPCVAHIDPQSPAFRAGLTRGMKIEKVNETPVAGMNHLDMVQLVTVSRVVVLHVTEGVVTPRRSVRKDAKSKPSELERGCNSDNPGVIKDAEDECFFLKDLEFTPPMHSSTPLPPAGHPMLLNNGKNILKKFMRKSPQALDSTIVQVIREDSKNLPSRSNRKMKKKKKDSLPQETKSGGSMDGATPMEADDFKASAKLDGGTIRLNLAGRPDVQSSSKMVDSTPQRDKTRMHVKDIFVQDDFASPTAGTSDHLSANTNILSTPVMNPKQSQWVLGRQSLSSSDIKDAKSEAARQIRGELTGKNQPIPFTPNVPPSPALNRVSPSPGVTLSKIFSKVTRRSQGEEFGSGSISDNSGGFHQQMDHGDAMKSSPYEMMSDSKLISNESEKVKVWSGVLS